MRSQCDPVGITQRGDPAGFGKAAAMRQIELTDLASSRGKQITECGQMRESFPGRNRRGDRGIDGGQTFEVFRPAGLFKEVQPIRINRLREPHPHCRRRTGVAVDHDVDVIADRLTHGGDTGLGRLDRFESLHRHRGRDRHRLEGAEAVCDGLAGEFGKLTGVVDRRFVEAFEVSAAQVTVQPDRIPDRSAPQPVTGHAVQLADDVPQCQVDAGNCRGTDDAVAMPEVLPPHHLPEVFDPRGVFSDDEFGEVFNGTDDAAGVPFECRFTPAEQAGLIGEDFDEHPVPHAGMADECFDAGDLHAASGVSATTTPGRTHQSRLIDETTVVARAREHNDGRWGGES